MNPSAPLRSATSDAVQPLGWRLEDHVDAMARELYAMRADQLRQALAALEQLSRLATHYLDLQQETSDSLSCAHLCQTNYRPIARSRK